LTSADSLSIFQLIDSLINLEQEKEKSQLAFRAGYNSNIVATGRPFQLGQFGVSGGSSFFHRSGFFVDATGYWSPEYTPSYFLTIASLGFMKADLKRFSFLVEYSRYFYNLSEEYASVSYVNNFTATALYEYKKLNIRFDYALYTGEKTGHRFTPSISLNFHKKNWWRLGRIAFNPTFSMMTGIEQTIAYIPLFKNRLGAIFRIRQGLPLYYADKNNTFGIMNYTFIAPLSISLKNWSFLLSYTYNIPRPLPNETTPLNTGGYLSFTITRYLDLGKR
jgi:hypothetical protein